MNKLIMDFNLNGNKYELYFTDKPDNDEDTFGLTDFATGRVDIKKDLSENQILRTIKHELTHIWLYEYGHNQHDENKTFNFEDVCEIVACSNDWINDIVNKYKFVTSEKIKEAKKDGNNK